MTPIAFHVIGLPGPMGSKRHVGNGVMIESSAKVKPWREAVVYAAIAHRPSVPLDGPLELRVVFTLPRPKSAAKARWSPDRKPDLSKLIRSTEDALTDAGLWADDARVVSVVASKVWPDLINIFGSLPIPGAVIAVGEANDPKIALAHARAMFDARRELGGNR